MQAVLEKGIVTHLSDTVFHEGILRLDAAVFEDMLSCPDCNL